jgi:hypothetical protein
MNEKIKQHIIAYNKEKGDDTTDECLIEAISESDVIYSERLGSRRWWNDVFRVCNINGMNIGYVWAETTGDSNPDEVGWEFDPSSICEVVEKIITNTIYEPKE